MMEARRTLSGLEQSIEEQLQIQASEEVVMAELPQVQYLDFLYRLQHFEVLLIPPGKEMLRQQIHLHSTLRYVEIDYYAHEFNIN